MIATLIGATLLCVVALVGLMVREVVTREYLDWGNALAQRFVGLAAHFVPPKQREERRDEWLGELAANQRERGTAAVMFAAGLVKAALTERTDDARSPITTVLRLLRRPGVVSIEFSNGVVSLAIGTVVEVSGFVMYDLGFTGIGTTGAALGSGMICAGALKAGRSIWTVFHRIPLGEEDVFERLLDGDATAALLVVQPPGKVSTATVMRARVTDRVRSMLKR
jgi:hypothetical protein